MNEQHETDILFHIKRQISGRGYDKEGWTETGVKEKAKGEEWNGGGQGERGTLL